MDHAGVGVASGLSHWQTTKRNMLTLFYRQIIWGQLGLIKLMFPTSTWTLCSLRCRKPERGKAYKWILISYCTCCVRSISLEKRKRWWAAAETTQMMIIIRSSQILQTTSGCRKCVASKSYSPRSICRPSQGPCHWLLKLCCWTCI